MYHHQGYTFYAKGWRSTPSGWCTVMADAEMCKNRPYYSSPKFKLRGFQERMWVNQTLKPFEVLGDDTHNNARWIKENRFILFSVGNETMHCPNTKYSGVSINLDAVTCLLKCDEECYSVIGSCRRDMKKPSDCTGGLCK